MRQLVVFPHSSKKHKEEEEGEEGKEEEKEEEEGRIKRGDTRTK